MKHVFCSLLLLCLTASAQTQTTVVVPAAQATAAGSTGLNYPISGYPSSSQYVYSESLILAAGIKPGDVLTGIQLRMATNTAGGPPETFTYANWDLTISRSLKAPGSLAAFFFENIATDQVAARRGELTFKADAMPSGKLINDWGVLIPFQKNYTYSGGPLLLTFSHDASPWGSGNPVDSVQDAVNVQNVSVLRYGTQQSTQAGPFAPVVRFTVQTNTTAPLFSAAGVLNAASYAGGNVAPGQIVTLFGDRLGGSAVASAAVNGGKFATVAGTTRVLFDGTPAAMIYSSATQVAAIVPYAVEAKATTQMMVEVGGVSSGPVTVPVIDAQPGIFTANASGKGQAALLNENGTLNGASTPAAAGSIVVIYLTGEGQTTPAGADGALALGPNYPKPILPVSVSIGGYEAEVLYAGAAPGAVAGLMQINARISPLVAPSLISPLFVRVGTRSSPTGVTLAVR